MRGGGTSQAGQAIGSGLIVDISKHFNKLLEVNVGERWARVEPGIVLDDLNASLLEHRLRFAPDISSASRATLGGMIANNSAGGLSSTERRSITYSISTSCLRTDLPRGSGRSRATSFRRYRPVARSRPPVTGKSAGWRTSIALKSSAGFRKFCGVLAATTSTSSSAMVRSISQS
jgi:hypothetical protein